MDPYARSILHDTNSNVNGLIASSAEGYTTPRNATPAWNELVIHELHIGTFTLGGGIYGRGSFASASMKLDDLRDLDITAAIERVVQYFEAHSMPYRALPDGEAIVVNGGPSPAAHGPDLA